MTTLSNNGKSGTVKSLLTKIKDAKNRKPSALERIGFAASSNIETDHCIRAETISVLTLKKLRNELDVSEDVALSLVSMSRATIARRKTLKPDEAGRVFRIASILALTEEVLGDHDKGVRWLKSPAYFLGGESPLSLTRTEAGAEEVRNLLFRIEHSVYS
jgi:putative toxin-antitoxin system antitoxin component (TIGR02293 family)